MDEQQPATIAKNTVTIEQAGPCKKKVSVEVPKETITKALDGQYETLRRDAIVPGFRRGRAPRRLLEKRFGKEAGETAKLKILAEASESAIKDNKLNILREPQIEHEKIEIPADGPLKFDFEVEVRPEFELPAMEGITVEKIKPEVSEALVDKEIEALLKYSGTWTPKDGAVEDNDKVVADCLLNIEGQEQKLDNTEIHVRANGFIGEVAVEKLDEVLIGAKAGDARNIEVTLPRTYFKEELRDKKVAIQLTVKDVKWLKPAEMSQEFIAKYGVTSEEELRKSIRQRLHKRLENESKNQMAEQIYKYLLDNIKLDLPVEVAADQAAALLRRQYINLMMQGVPREQIDGHIEQLKAGSEQQAQQQLKIYFIMEKIAEKMGIETSEEEINGHIAQMAKERRVRPERMKEEMQRDGSIEQFKQQVREQKVIAKLLETARITEVEPKPQRARPIAPKHPASPKGSAEASKKTAEKTVEKHAKKPSVKVTAKEKTEKKTRPTPRKKKTEG